MAPQRLAPIAEHPERIGAVLTAGIGAGLAILGPHCVELVVWILGAMGVDLLSGLLRALILRNLSKGAFATGVLKKLLILLLLYPAAMVDRVFAISGIVADGAGPVLFAAMLGIVAYEGASITRNVQRVVGKTVFTLALLRALDALRKLPDPLPNRRTYDRGDPTSEDSLEHHEDA